MKRILILLSIAAFSLNAYSQPWKTVKIDSALSVKLPKGFNKTTPDDQKNFSATTGFGTILIFKDPDNPETTQEIGKEKQLQKYYDDYIARVKASSKDGIISNEKDTLIGKLNVKDFKLETDSGSGKQYRFFRILHANDATYTFEFLYQDIHEEFALKEKDEFFNSITFTENLNKQDQFTDDAIVKPADNTNTWLVAGGGALLAIVIIIVALSRRKKRTG